MSLINLAKVIALVAIFFINPLIVGSVYVAFIVFRMAAKSIHNKHDRFWAILVAALFVAFIAPLVFAVFPGFLFCAAFAGLLTWAFYPHDKTHVQSAYRYEESPYGPQEDVIDAEIISEKTIYPNQ